MNDQNASVHAYNRGKAKGEAKERARIATQLRAEADRRRASDRDDMEPEIDAAVARALEDAADSIERAQPGDETARESPIEQAKALLLDGSGDGDDQERRDLDAADIGEAHGFGPREDESPADWADRMREEWADAGDGKPQTPCSGIVRVTLRRDGE